MTDVRIVTEPLGGSPLSLLLQGDRAPANWLAAAPASADGWRAAAEARRAEGDWAARWKLLAPALNARGRAAERLARVMEQGGVVITTGQQPGLFGGPVYAWSKAVGALALADAIERATGIATAAIYWAATDDADFDEAASTVVPVTGGLEVLRSEHEPTAGTPMSLALLGELDEQLRMLRDASGSAADSAPLDITQRAYGDPKSTVGGAFVALLRGLLEPLGIPVLDASHPAVIETSRATIQLALTRAATIDESLAERGREIRAAGHEPQVEEMAGMSLVFQRERDTKRRLTVDEASAGLAGVLTPNVLLRPIVERAILPTLAYLAGPGELAYFAQVTAVARAMGVTAPVALPRWSCTLIEPRIQRLLQRYDASVADLAAPDLLEGRLARAAMTPGMTRELERVRRVLGDLPGALGSDARELGLESAVLGAATNLQHRLDRLERRLVAGIKRRESDQMRDVGTMRAALHPRGARQERVVNLIPMLARNGVELLSEMHAAAGAHAESLVHGTTQ